MATIWESEALDLDSDPESGAEIVRLTAAPMTNVNIYCELPYNTPCGKRIAYLRAPTSDPRFPPSQQLCVADLDRLKVALIDPDIRCSFVGTHSWSGKIYYLRPNGELIRVDLQTLEKEIVMTHWELPMDMILWTVSPDHRYFVSTMRRPDFTCAIVRLDLVERTHKVIFEHDEDLTHVQIDPVRGEDILVQWSRGQRVNDRREKIPGPTTPKGTTHFIIDIDGGNRRDLAVGEPHTSNSCGHSAWIADTGRVGLAVNWKGMTVNKSELAKGNLHDERHPQGNFVTVGPDDEKPRIFDAPEHLFNHVNISKCGRYFASDSYRNGIPGPIELVIGNIESGKYRTLVSDCGAQGGGPASGHPHAYLTADNQHLIYNADPQGICHVHKARLPDDFLPSLD